MKRYSIIISLHIVVLVLLSMATLMLFMHELWFTAFTALLIIAGVALHLYHLQMCQLDLLRQAVQSLKYEDMTQRFHPPFQNSTMERLNEELTDAFKSISEHQLENENRLQYYRNLLDKVDIAVLVTDNEGKIEWMNEASITLIGNPVGLPESIFSHLTDEVIEVERNGQSFKLTPSVSYFGNVDGKRLLISLKNIRTLLDKNEIEAWQKLTRVLTHEIMNSITPIISLSETLSEREVPAATMQQAIQTIHRRSKGLLEFVENYRKLTRIPQPNKRCFFVKELFEQMHNLYPQIDIKFDCQPEELKLTADYNQLEQVLINLLKNAQEACIQRSNPLIEVSAIRMPEYTEISVRDNGMGILPEVQERIFVPFFTTKPTGNGIGLSLCRQIMALHNGTIQVHSKEGEGTKFILRFEV